MPSFSGVRIIDGGPFKDFALVGVASNLTKTVPDSHIQEPGASAEVDVLWDHLSMRMRELGLVQPYGLIGYVEAYTHASRVRYAIVVNANTSYQTVYVAEGPSGIDDTWALEALREIVHLFIEYRISHIDANYVRATTGDLQRFVAGQGLTALAETLAPLNDGLVADIASQLGAFASSIAVSLGKVSISDDDHLGEITIHGVSGSTFYVDSSYIDPDAAKEIGVPAGVYAMVSIILDDDHNGVVGDMSDHFTVLRRGKNEWLGAPFQERASQPQHVATLVGVTSLEKSTYWRPSLRETLKELVRVGE